MEKKTGVIFRTVRNNIKYSIVNEDWSRFKNLFVRETDIDLDKNDIKKYFLTKVFNELGFIKLEFIDKEEFLNRLEEERFQVIKCGMITEEEFLENRKIKNNK